MEIQLYQASTVVEQGIFAVTNLSPTSPRVLSASLISWDFPGGWRIDIYGSGGALNQTTNLWSNGWTNRIEIFRDSNPVLSIRCETYGFVNEAYRFQNEGISQVVNGALNNVSFRKYIIGSNFADSFLMKTGGWEGTGAGSGTTDNRISGGPGDDTIDSSTLGRQSNVIDGGVGLDTLILPAGTQLNIDGTGTGGTAYGTTSSGSIQYTTSVRFSSIEYAYTSEASYLPLAKRFLPDMLLSPGSAQDNTGTQVFRFAKLSNGQYFYTGSIAEKNSILATNPGFRYEGVVFNAQDSWDSGYRPVYRFADVINGGYFYTATPAERDSVFSQFPNYRYEGASFFVLSAQTNDSVPVFRLANTTSGGYLFTSNPVERSYAASLGNWRDEGIAFYAPRQVRLANGMEDLAANEGNHEIAAWHTDPGFQNAYPEPVTDAGWLF